MGNNDLQDIKNKHGIIFLKFPMEKLDPGEVYESELKDKTKLHDKGYLTDFIENTVNPTEVLDLPNFITQEVDITTEGLVSMERIGELNISFLKGLLMSFKKIILKAKVGKYQLTYAKLNNISFKELKEAALQNRLKNFRIIQDYQSNIRNLYVVTKVFFTEGMDLLFNLADEKEIKSVIDASKTVDADLSIKSKTKATYTLNTSRKIVFGVSLASLDYQLLKNGGELRINSVPEDEAEKIYLCSYYDMPIEEITINLTDGTNTEFSESVTLIKDEKN